LWFRALGRTGFPFIVLAENASAGIATATTPAHTPPAAAHAFMFSPALLATLLDGVLLLRGQQAMDLLLGLLAGLLDLIALLVGAQRSVLADADHLLVGGFVDSHDLLPSGVGDAGLLEAGWFTATRPRLGRGRRFVGGGSTLLILGEQQGGNQERQQQGDKETGFTFLHTSASCFANPNCIQRVVVTLEKIL
jgi:hypothetical protein